MRLHSPATITLLFPLAAILAACPGDDTSGQDGPGTATGADTESCPDNGLIGCPCIEGGLCVAGGLCVDGTCVSEQGGTGEPEGDTEKDPVQTTGADSSGGVIRKR